MKYLLYLYFCSVLNHPSIHRPEHQLLKPILSFSSCLQLSPFTPLTFHPSSSLYLKFFEHHTSSCQLRMRSELWLHEPNALQHLCHHGARPSVLIFSCEVELCSSDVVLKINQGRASYHSYQAERSFQKVKISCFYQLINL